MLLYPCSASWKFLLKVTSCRTRRDCRRCWFAFCRHRKVCYCCRTIYTSWKFWNLRNSDRSTTKRTEGESYHHRQHYHRANQRPDNAERYTRVSSFEARERASFCNCSNGQSRGHHRYPQIEEETSGKVNWFGFSRKTLHQWELVFRNKRYFFWSAESKKKRTR